MGKRHKGMRRLLWAIGAMVLTAACGSECYENQNALPQAIFMLSDSTPVTVSIDSIEVYGIGAPGDSILWKGGQVSSLYLPFRVDHDTTQYVFRVLDTDWSDTVTFIYRRSPRFVSEACGVSYIYDIEKITSSGIMIDSVVCPDGQITNSARENLIIYLRND